MAKKIENNNSFEIEVEIDNGMFINEVVDREPIAFTMATDVAFDILKELNGNAMGVYLALLKHRNTKNNRCFPSQETIAKEANMNIKTVKSCIDKLEQNGYLIINSGYKGTSSNYYFPKEYFYDWFKDDYKQKRAKRRKNPLIEKRETKAEKENKELRNEVERLKRELEKERFKSNDYTYSKTADYDPEDPFADYLDEENPFEENPFTKCRTLYATR